MTIPINWQSLATDPNDLMNILDDYDNNVQQLKTYITEMRSKEIFGQTKERYSSI